MAKALCAVMTMLFLVDSASAQTGATPSDLLGQSPAPKAIASSMFSSDEPRCKSGETDGLPYSYCINESDPSLNPDILYYLHREESSERAWLTETEATNLREEWKRRELAPPTVISISFGPKWLLTEKQKGRVRDLHAFFVNVLVAKLEAQLKKPRKGQRLLFGASMGGFNAAMLLLKNGGVFHKVALVCPVPMDLNPFAAEKEINAFIVRTGAERERVVNSLEWAKREFTTPADWRKHDVLSLARQLLTKSSPELFLLCREKDELGSHEGTKKFADIAQSKGMIVQFHAMKGSHKGNCEKSLADFLIEPSIAK